MRVLVTGASGQVGTALIRRLQGEVTVIGTDRLTLDLSRPEAIPAVLDRIRPDVIINAAAYTAVDKAEAEPDLAQRVNGEAPGVMAHWSAQSDVPLVHFSSDYVFDGSGQRPWSEEDVTGPLSVYGASKLAGEDQIRGAAGPSLILRTSWVYAPRGANFLRTIARGAATQRELRVVADQVGAPTPAALIAETVDAMLADGLNAFRARAGEARGLVHVAASGEASRYLFASEIVRGLKARGDKLAVERIVPMRTAEWPTPAKRPLNSRLSLERLRTVFGITTPDWRAVLAPELDQLTEVPHSA